MAVNQWLLFLCLGKFVPAGGEAGGDNATRGWQMGQDSAGVSDFSSAISRWALIWAATVAENVMTTPVMNSTPKAERIDTGHPWDLMSHMAVAIPGANRMAVLIRMAIMCLILFITAVLLVVELFQEFREMLLEPVAELIFCIYQGLLVENPPNLTVIDLVVAMTLHVEETDISRQRGFSSDTFAVIGDVVSGIGQCLQQNAASSLNG